MGQKLKIKLPDGKIVICEVVEEEKDGVVVSTLKTIGDIAKEATPKEVSTWVGDFCGAYKDGKKLGKKLFGAIGRLFQRD